MSNPLTLENIKESLKDRRLYVVSEATGLSYYTLKKIRDDDDDVNVTTNTIEKLSQYLSGEVGDDHNKQP